MNITVLSICNRDIYLVNSWAIDKQFNSNESLNSTKLLKTSDFFLWLYLDWHTVSIVDLIICHYCFCVMLLIWLKLNLKWGLDLGIACFKMDLLENLHSIVLNLHTPGVTHVGCYHQFIFFGTYVLFIWIIFYSTSYINVASFFCYLMFKDICSGGFGVKKLVQPNQYLDGVIFTF